MEILKKRPPQWVFVQDGVGEAEDLITMTDNNGELPRFGLGQSRSPHLAAVRDHIPVEVGVQVGTSVVASPAVGMEGGNAIGIGLRRVDVLHNKVPIYHADLLIDPGSGTVQ